MPSGRPALFRTAQGTAATVRSVPVGIRQNRDQFRGNELHLLRQTQQDTDRTGLETLHSSSPSQSTPLLLIHPIGVGLSSRFWDRFISCWRQRDPAAVLLAPDLIGCGDAACPPEPLTPEDWAAPLIGLLRDRNSGPAVLVVQGASLPIALTMLEQAPELVSSLVAICPPGWRVLQQEVPPNRAHRLWRWLFQGVSGNLFYRYARRRRFLDAFSRNNLFADAEAVDEEWLSMLEMGSRAMNTRWAVYSFLAGFWRRDWIPQLTGLTVPLQILFGANATGIGRSRNWDDVDERMDTYFRNLPNASITTIPGRNVLPYESTVPCVDCVREWLSSR